MSSALSPWAPIMTPQDTRALQHGLAPNGPLSAVPRLLCAILINHIRRVLIPPLGQFVWYNALDTMKMSLSSPGHLLDESATFAWRDVMLWAVHMGAFHGVRRAVKSTAVLYAGMSLALLEAFYVETCWVGAHVFALARVEKGTVRLGLVLLVVVGAWRVFRVRRGGWVFWGVVWACTAWVVRYSNRWFMVLELSDMVVTFGWMVVAMVAVCAWKVGMVMGLAGGGRRHE